MTLTFYSHQETLEPGGNLVPVTTVLIGTEELGRLLGPGDCGSILFQAKGHYHEPATFLFNNMEQAKHVIQDAFAFGVVEVVTRRMREIARNN